MIEFQRLSLWDRIAELLLPARRAERDRRTREAIRYLVMNPSAPCVIGGMLVADGFGGSPLETE
jgi:hypothetical protein